MSEQQAVLSVRGLRTHFVTPERTVKAVDGITYDLHAGKTLAIVGESGSGKSVHALSILGLLPMPPAKIVGGEILFRGDDLLKMDRESLRKVRGNRIAMIFQEPMTSLNPVLKVGEQIAEAVMLHQGASKEKAWAKAVDLLKKVGIPHPEERVNDFPHQFSGGMRQRAMIAIALSCEPDVLIADEPTTALDVTIQAQILDLLKRLQSELGMSIVLITHDLGIVAEFVDEVVVMYAGVVVERAQVQELFAHPRHPYTQGLLASVPSLAAGGARERLKAIAGVVPELKDLPRGCRFQDRCPDVFDRCRRSEPPLYAVGGAMARCYLHVPQSGTEAGSEAAKGAGA